MIRKIWVAAFFLATANVLSGPVMAQDSSDAIGGFLKELFPQMENRQDRPVPQLSNPGHVSSKQLRRVPFGQSEVQLSFAPLVKKASPSVVNVYAAKRVQQRRSPFAGDPFFEQFFGERFGQSQPRVQSSLGSGVIIDASGLIVTNNHVIEGADEIKVALADGREFNSKVVLRDERSDLAILSINTKAELKAIRFAPADQLQTGDLVLAIGNPFGVGQTITSGIVSAVARTRVGVSDFGFFIQTDAAINPGNSGGALIDMSGRLVGINTAIFTRSGGSNGIGFAVPANMVRAVLRQAKGGSEAFERPYLGAEFEPVTSSMAESLGMRRPSGAIVTGINKNSPAQKAGLRVGDVVLSINGQRIEHPDALGYRIATLQAGNKIDIDVFSRGKLKTLTVRLTKQPKTAKSKTVMLKGRTPFSGAEVSQITNQLVRKFRLRGVDNGVMITGIARGSGAARAGFRPGDVIEFINGNQIVRVEDVEAIIADGGRSWRFRINRGGRRIQQFLRF